MQTATIIMPRRKGPAHTFIEQSLLNRFGGYSEYRGRGAWRDVDGLVYTEPHIRYEVAFDETSHAWEVIKAVAINAGQAQGEKAVYVQLGTFAQILETGV